MTRFTPKIFLSSIISFAAWFFIHVIAKTSRVGVYHHPEFQKIFDAKEPCIFAFWHRFQIMMMYDYRNRGASVLVSQSRDGELIAQGLHRFGYKTIRGSSSRGGGVALKAMIDRLKEGAQVAFTPDGPRGPYRSVQPGVVLAAQETGLPIIPAAWAASREKTLSSWDRFLVPLPFTRYEFVYGEPLYLSKDDPDAGQKVQNALDEARKQAKRALNGSDQKR